MYEDRTNNIQRLSFAVLYTYDKTLFLVLHLVILHITVSYHSLLCNLKPQQRKGVGNGTEMSII